MLLPPRQRAWLHQTNLSDLIQTDTDMSLRGQFQIASTTSFNKEATGPGTEPPTQVRQMVNVEVAVGDAGGHANSRTHGDVLADY